MEYDILMILNYCIIKILFVEIIQPENLCAVRLEFIFLKSYIIVLLIKLRGVIFNRTKITYLYHVSHLR